MRARRLRRLDLALAPADQLPRDPSGNELVPLKLILANKAYSSWSLRPWILLAQLKIPFEEVIIPMDQPETRAGGVLTWLWRPSINCRETFRK